MDVRSKMPFLVLVIVALVAMCYPMADLIYCTEPEMGYIEKTLVSFGVLAARRSCPTGMAILMEVLKNVVCVAFGTMLGYFVRKLVVEKPMIRTWYGWIPPDDPLGDIDDPVPDGFIPGVTVRHLY